MYFCAAGRGSVGDPVTINRMGVGRWIKDSAGSYCNITVSRNGPICFVLPFTIK